MNKNTPQKNRNRFSEKGLKHCGRCNQDKPKSEFYSSAGKIRAGCKACHRAASSERSSEYYRTHKAETDGRVTEWRRNNRGRYNKMVSAGVKRYRQRKADRGQTFLPLTSPQNSPPPANAIASPLQRESKSASSARPRTRARKSPPVIS
jgi:hypothetical protein